MADSAGTNMVIEVKNPATGNDLRSGWDKVESLSVEIPVRTQLDPKIIQRIDGCEQYIRQQTECSVGGAIGAPDYLSTIRFIARGAGPDARGLPETAVDAGILWDYYRVLLGRERLNQVLDDGYSRSLITIFLKDANFVNTARLIERIREYERKYLAPDGIKLEFAGDVAVSQSLIRGIVSTQMQSLFWSSLGIFAVIAILSGSWLRGLYCMIPSLIAVALKFAIMGWAGITLGVATSMFAAMTLGIGVNCAIHHLEGFDRSRHAGRSISDSWIQALRSTGPAAFINTMAVCLGFGVLTVSQVPANSRLGTLLVLGLVSCSLVSLALLPALLARTPRPN
jgi:predicted RND superfamily exporter protein